MSKAWKTKSTMTKYHAQPTTIDGIRFASRAEAARYQELQLLVYAGEITKLVCHPRYLLLEAFTDRFGNKEPKVVYIGDFQYFENGQLVVEDVKGYETDLWKLKRKLFRRTYPHIELREVKA